MLVGGDGCIAKAVQSGSPDCAACMDGGFAREDLAEAAAIQQKVICLWKFTQVGTPLFPILKKRWQSKESSAAPLLPCLSRKRIRGFGKIRGFLKSHCCKERDFLWHLIKINRGKP